MSLKIPKISVIIPVYNVAEYLKRSLDSVCNQTLQDIEIICIDDCSSDDSANILKQYAENYKNLKAIHLEKNQGKSATRNAGLTLAKGEYLAFVDSDDEIDLNFYEKLYDKAKETDADIVKGQAVEISYSGYRHCVKQIKQGGDKLLFVNYWWSAIYKKSLIRKNNISFSVDHPLGEDLLFLNKAVIAAKNLQLVNDTYYNYYRREDSGDSKILSEEKIKSALSIFEMIVDNINATSTNSSVYNFVIHHFIMGCFYLSVKSDGNKGKQLCAKAAFNIFEKCQNSDSLELSFSQTTPNLFKLLKNKDTAAVEDLFIKCKSCMEIITSGLRTRIQNK